MRERYISLFPSTRTVGVAIWLLDNSYLRTVAVGTVPTTGLLPLLQRLLPDTIYLEGVRERDGSLSIPIPEGAKFRFAHPEWRNNRTVLPFLRRVSPLARNAYHMGFNEVVRRSGSNVIIRSPIDVEHLDDRWYTRWGIR